MNKRPANRFVKHSAPRSDINRKTPGSMKIRIRGNSIRYRLTMSEVASFSASGLVEESTFFGDTTFRYILKSTPAIDSLHATFENNTIALWVPENDAKGWAASSRIGFSGTVALEKGGQLSLLLEKDFTCLDETGEDQSDNYPNPKTEEHE
jgi:hypothetical protein